MRFSLRGDAGATMRHDLMDLLACPVCHGTLQLQVTSSSGEEILSGTLRCGGCQARYPIEDGIPDLLPPPSAGA